jgi:hypothetical protein
MTKQSRALQMAINALTNCSRFEEAIQACKEALEQPKEPQYLYVFQSLSGNFSCRKERHAFEYIGEYLGKIKLEVNDAD